MSKSQHNTRHMLLATLAVAVAALLTPAPTAHAQDKTFTMKLSTATINDTQHEWFRRFAALVEKDSGGRIKAHLNSGSFPSNALAGLYSRTRNGKHVVTYRADRAGVSNSAY